MTQDEYEQRVMLVLSQHTDAAASQLSRALGLLPDGSKEVAIEIFVDQDGEEGSWMSKWVCVGRTCTS